MAGRRTAGAAVVLLAGLLVTPVPATSAGCVPLTTSWAEPAVAFAGTAASDCVAFDGEPGQVVWPTARSGDGSPVAGSVTDSAGDAACPPLDPEVCTLTGPAPYRFTTVAEGETYRVAVRDMSGMTGCPTVTPTAYDVEPADDHPGSGCRRLSAATNDRYVVRVSGGAAASVRDGTGAAVDCDGTDAGPAVCELDGSVHLLAVDPLGATFRTAFHRTGAAGCGTEAGPGLGRSDDVSGRLSGAALDCVTLDHPRGSVVDVLGALGLPTPALTVLDGDGSLACSLRADDGDLCRLSGPAPHRALVTLASPSRYRLVVPRLDDPVGCARLPRRAGSDGVRSLVLRVPRGRVATCLTASSRFLLGTSLYGVRRLDGRAPARLTVRDTSDGQCVGEGRRRFVFECRRYRPVGRTTSIVLTTDGRGGRWRLGHQFINRHGGAEPHAGG